MGSSRPSKSQSTAATRSKAKAAATVARAEAERSERTRRRSVLVVLVLAGLAVFAGIAWSLTRGGTDAAGDPNATDLKAVSGLGAVQAPPWSAPTDVSARAAAAGLPLGAMGGAEHYHVHLDVLVNGEPVDVPANVGVDASNGSMSYLHTHTPDGLVHIEAGSAGQPFTLGQLFTEWDVRLTATQVGALQVDDSNELTLYVDGEKVPGNPAMLRLQPQQQVALVYGPKGQNVEVPSTYDFAPGE